MSALPDTVDTILKNIRPMIRDLSSDERLALIEAIAAIESRDASQDAIAAEQTAWFARLASERQRYQGQFVAVKDGQVIDQDADRRALYLRIRQRFGRQPVLIVSADWKQPPEFTLRSPWYLDQAEGASTGE